MASPATANQNVTKFLRLALPEKEGLGQPVSACLLSTSHLTGYNTSLPSIWREFLALTNQQMHRSRSFWSTNPSRIVQLFRVHFYLLDWMLPDSKLPESSQ